MKEQLEGLSLLVRLTTSSMLTLAFWYPSIVIAQPRILVPVAPALRSNQAPPTPPPTPEKEEEEPAEPADEPAEPDEEPAEPEEGGGTEQIAPKYKTP